MSYSTYRALPIETLYELLESSIKEMLVALDTKQDNMIQYKAIRKQVETLLDIISQKKKENVSKN